MAVRADNATTAFQASPQFEPARQYASSSPTGYKILPVPQIRTVHRVRIIIDYGTGREGNSPFK
jgi:hypothetical protein